MSKHKKAIEKHASKARLGTSARSALTLGVLAGVALIVVAAFLAYSPSLSGGFIWDDHDLLTENELVKVSNGLYRFWCTSEAYDYWPMTNTTFWMEWRLWGMNSTGYHVTNLVLHIIEALMIWFILRKMSIPGAFLAGMIFAVHPVNVESVAWIAERKNTMAMLFFLLSILFYLKIEIPCHLSAVSYPPSAVPCPLFYWLSLAAFILAMLSKGSAAILPMLLLGIVWWLRKEGTVPIFVSTKMGLSPPISRWDLARTAPFFVVAVVLGGVNVWFQTHGSGEVARTAGYVERLLGAGGVVWFYLYKAILPFDLAFVYPQWQIEVGNPLWWLPLSGALVVTAILWRYRESWSRPLLFAWGFFCVALLSVMGFADVGFARFSLVADRYQHIAIIGVIALAAALWSQWRHRVALASRQCWAANVVAILAVVALVFLTWRQSRLYCDEIVLYQATLEKNPDCYMGHYNLGKALFDTGRLQDAIKHFEQSLKLKPNDPKAHNNLGMMLFQAGMYQEAIDHYQQAIGLKPDLADAHYNMGTALLRTGRPQEAIEYFRQALRLQPDNLEVLCNLGISLAQTGLTEEAIECYKQALQLKPNYTEVHYNLGVVLVQIGQAEEAIKHYEEALRLKSDYPEVHNNLGAVLFQTGRAEEAIDHFKQAIQMRPDNINAYNNLALAYASIQRSSEAIAASEKALELARLQGETVQAGEIEEWLNSYRASLSYQRNTSPPSKSTPPPP